MPQDNVIESPFAQQEQETQHPSDSLQQTIALLHKVKKVLNVTAILFLAMIGALAIFGYSIFDPTIARIIAASLYSIGVLWPAIYLYLKKV